MSKMTRREVEKVLAGVPEDRRADVLCGLVGHSRIQEACWGYYSCARCGQQVGDTLASVYPDAETAVVVGHNCETCRENAKTLTWRDTLLAPDPFADEEVEA